MTPPNCSPPLQHAVEEKENVLPSLFRIFPELPENPILGDH